MPTAPSTILSTTLSALLKVPPPPTMKKFRCYAVVERQGREQRYRFYSSDNWKAMQESQGAVVDISDGTDSQDEIVAEEMNENVAVENEDLKMAVKRKLEDSDQQSDISRVDSDTTLKQPKRTRRKSATTTKKQKTSRSTIKLSMNNDEQEADDVEFSYGGTC
jgi:hypothetical protein